MYLPNYASVCACASTACVFTPCEPFTIMQALKFAMQAVLGIFMNIKLNIIMIEGFVFEL